MPDHDYSTSGVSSDASESPARLAVRQALREACDKAGGQKPLAARIGTTQSMVWYWLERARRGVPAEYVLLIEAATGISRHALRPDIFPRDVAQKQMPVSGPSHISHPNHTSHMSEDI